MTLKCLEKPIDPSQRRVPSARPNMISWVASQHISSVERSHLAGNTDVVFDQLVVPFAMQGNE
jgi:hypothetical protein